MPYITVKLLEGRSRKRKEMLVKKLTEAACESLEIESSQVRVELIELAEGTFAVAGKFLETNDDC